MQRKEYEWVIFFIYLLNFENLLWELDLKDCEILFFIKTRQKYDL